MSRSYPVWNIIDSCAYSGNKSYGIRKHGEVEVRVGSSSRNSHFSWRQKLPIENLRMGIVNSAFTWTALW